MTASKVSGGATVPVAVRPRGKVLEVDEEPDAGIFTSGFAKFFGESVHEPALFSAAERRPAPVSLTFPIHFLSRECWAKNTTGIGESLCAAVCTPVTYHAGRA
ncbi:MAG: hypothetical protein V4674_02225 [Patescibacteria group bacterium]